jgi:[1-hydroxy-2-(trimethylamino)ethyl]phosphonate dioxygenase
MTLVPVVDAIFDVFLTRGDDTYLGEEVSLTEHMLQTAMAAEQDDASPELVAAAVLHDFGHMVHDLDESCADDGIDSFHEEVGADYLERHFSPAVTEPIRLHVATKRYLCAVDPAYLEQLSPASLHSLELQGGPFTPDEVLDFEEGTYFTDAVKLRRYDDIAKIPGLETPDLEHYRPILEQQLVSEETRRSA